MDINNALFEEELLKIREKYYILYNDLRDEMSTKLNQFYKEFLSSGSKLWQINSDFHNDIYNLINNYKKE